MRYIRFQFVCFLVVFIFSLSAFSLNPENWEQKDAAANANNDTTYKKLRNIALGTETAHITNMVLKREAAEFTFQSGAFYFLEAVNGKVTGAVFVGRGSLEMKPPIASEVRSLAFLTKGKPFHEEFSTAVFRFTDGTYEELKKAADSSPASSAENPASILSDNQDALRKKLRLNLNIRILQDILSAQSGGFFIAFIKGTNYSGKMVYTVDPHGVAQVSPEEVALFTWDDEKSGVWLSSHRLSEYAAGKASGTEENGWIDIEHQKLDTTIEKNASLSGTAVTTFTSRVNGLRVVPLDLFRTLRVQSVKGPNGEDLPFIQEAVKEDSDFAVILPKELAAGEKYSLTTIYKEANRDSDNKAVSNEGGGNYFPIARDNWYPSSGFGDYATFDMTFNIPKGLKMVATGNLVREFDEGSQTISEWKSTAAQGVAGFNFGRFQREVGKPPTKSYVIETYANKDQPDIIREIQHFAEQADLPTGTMSTLGLAKKAMAEGQLAAEIYTDYFGQEPFDHVAITQQTAPGFGQAWPGLIYLPITSFFDSTTRHQIGFDDIRGYFKAVGPHEFAHQWWGHTVGWKSYRDQWMSEGFSETSASIFLQAVYNQKGPQEFIGFWKDELELMTEKNKEGNRAIDVGPVTQGFRLSNSRAGFDIYRRLIYPKGGYILHMIRMMLYTSRSKDPDERFKAMMHEFVGAYKNRPASTEDFKAMVEKHMLPEMDLNGNHKMDWFFDEYVYGTQLPGYNFQHSFEKDASGDQVLKFKITQSGVAENFQMVVPIYLELANGRVMKLGTIPLTGNSAIEQVVPIKGLKDRPKRAILAYYQDVLGVVTQ